jgi:hypothetical protein
VQAYRPKNVGAKVAAIDKYIKSKDQVAATKAKSETAFVLASWAWAIKEFATSEKSKEDNAAKIAELEKKVAAFEESKKEQ